MPLTQGQYGNGDSQYALRLRHVTEGEEACVLLRQDGRYHFERVLSDKTLVYEGSISTTSLRDILTLVNDDELRSLNQDGILLHLVAPSRDELDLRIARGTEWQKLLFPDVESRSAFRQSLDPLLKWFGALPTDNRTQLGEDEGKTNCLPPRTEEIRLTKRGDTISPTPAKSSPSFVDSYMLRIVVDQLGVGQAKRTCAIVYPNGFYHLEKSRQNHQYSNGVYEPDILGDGIGGKIGADVFEQFLDGAATAELRKLLDNPEMIASRHSSMPGRNYSDADITFLFIPREDGLQRLTFADYFAREKQTAFAMTPGPGVRHADSASGLVKPLREWLKSNIESRKAARLKEVFGNNCAPVAARVAPSEISVELAQVVPSDLDAVSAPANELVATATPAVVPSSIPSPKVANEDVGISPANGNETATSLRITTRMVLLDVIATTKDGSPVPDLHPADIQVLEDGQPQTVRFFSRASNVTAGNRKRTASQLPPGVYTNRPDESQNAEPVVLLLLDGINTPATDQLYARQQLLEYVRRLKADQRVAILALGSRLFLLQDFTADPQVLRSALESYSASDSPLLTRSLPTQITPQMAEVMGFPWAVPLQSLTRANQENLVNTTDERIRATLAALDSIARSMVGYSGRKTLVWVSSGFPVSLRLGGRNSSLSRSYAAELSATATRLSQAQIAVYPVDARGLIADLKDTPAQPDQVVQTIPPLGSTDSGAEALTRIAPLVAESHLEMEQIAQDTGGRAFYDANNLTAAVTAAVQDGNSYYRLGYYPSDKNWNGQFRKIAIETERKDIKLRYRPGYYALDPTLSAAPPGAQPDQDRVQEAVRAIMDPLPSTGVSFWAHLVLPGTGDSATYVEFLVDANTISCADAGSHHDCNLDFVTFTVAPNGTILSTLAKNTQIPLPAAQYASIRKKGLPYRMQINSLPEHGSLRLAVRDNRTSLLGTLTIPIPAGPAQVGVKK